MEEWNQGGNFINKPVRGWLHPDKKIADSGISYGVRVSILIYWTLVKRIYLLFI